MKTYNLNLSPKILYSVVGLLGLLVTSCGSYQNTSYNDKDGIYDDGSRRNPTANQNNSSGNGYREYFGSKQDDVVVFTDVDNYNTAQDSTQNGEARGYESGYSGWGSDTDNVTVNVYGNNWGWNNWYAPGWGWGWNNGWGWNTGWGWNAGYGWNGWYGPSFGLGWGWNNWYGPAYGYGWNGYYGHGHHNNHYSYQGGVRGVRNEMYGERSNVGRQYNSGTRSSTYSTTRRSTNVNGTRNNQFGNPRSTVRNNSGTRSQNYTPSRSSTRNNTYTPSSSGGTRNYTPSSSGGGRSSGGGSYGGGGGRSGGGGSRR